MPDAAATAPAAVTEAQRLTAEGYTFGVNKRDGQPHRAFDWKRLIRPEWNDSGNPGGNLLADIADIRASGVALQDYQARFIDHIERVATRRCPDGSLLAMLTTRQFHRLRTITFRHAHWRLLQQVLTPKPREPDQPYEFDVDEDASPPRYIPWRGETYFTRSNRYEP